MSDNMFSASGQPAGATPNGGAATPPNDSFASPFADLLGLIKNERGEPKYKDLPTALEALKHSQEFIPQIKADKEALERRLQEIEAENARLKGVEEALARFQAPAAPVQNTPASNGLSPDAVAELVTKTLTQREQAAKNEANVAQVINRAKEMFGAEADKVFYKKAEELGMSAAQINALSAQSPQAVFALLGLGKAAAPVAQPAFNSSTINTDGYQPQPTSFISKNQKSALLGASTEELKQEQDSAKKLVEELHAKGLSTYDLTDPKEYFKHFK